MDWGRRYIHSQERSSRNRNKNSRCRESRSKSQNTETEAYSRVEAGTPKGKEEKMQGCQTGWALSALQIPVLTYKKPGKPL